MQRQSTSFRATLVALVLLAQVSVSVAGLCAIPDCNMTPPTGTITAACCCDTDCGGIVAADLALLPVEEKAPSTHGVALAFRFSPVYVPFAPGLAVVQRHEQPRRPQLFQLYQSFRL